MVKAARANDRVMQVGTHRRVTPHGMSFYKFLNGGGAGKIGMVRAFVTGAAGMGQPDKPSPNQEPPAGLDWDMWCGPAPYRPYNAAIHPLKWRQFLDYANGQLGDWVHWIDQIYWVIGDEKQPTTVSAVGGHLHPRAEPQGRAAQHGRARRPRHPGRPLAVRRLHRHLGASPVRRQQQREGRHRLLLLRHARDVCHIGWNDGWTFYPANKKDPEVHDDAHLHSPGSQNVPELWADFIDAIQSERRPVCRHRDRPPLHDAAPCWECCRINSAAA